MTIHKSAFDNFNPIGDTMLQSGKSAKLTFYPRGNNVLLERVAPSEITAGGLVLPDRCREKTLLAKVLDVGPGKEIPIQHRGGMLPPIKAGTEFIDAPRFEHVHGIEVGDLVFFNIRHAIPCEPEDDGRLCVVDADHILAVVKQGE